MLFPITRETPDGRTLVALVVLSYLGTRCRACWAVRVRLGRAASEGGEGGEGPLAIPASLLIGPAARRPHRKQWAFVLFAVRTLDGVVVTREE